MPCSWDSRTGEGLPAWLAVVGILTLFTLALTWLAVIAGPSASRSTVQAFAYPLIFLPFVSSAFVLTATMPAPVRRSRRTVPVTSVVNSTRSLFLEQPVAPDIWIALAWCVGILVIAYGVAMTTYRRRLA